MAKTVHQIMKTLRESLTEVLLPLLLLLLIGCPQFLQANNFTADDWVNGTQLMEAVDNTTTNSSGYTIIKNSKEENILNVPRDPLRRVALAALMLHILVVGGGLIIYSVAWCKIRGDKKRLSGIQRRLQSPLTLQHIPNTPNCLCHGCRVGRQILSSLIVQQILNERSER